VLKAVLDTNIFISAIHFGGSPAEVIREGLGGKARFFISREIIAEVIGVLRKKFLYEEEVLEEVEDLLGRTCELVEPRQTVKIIKDKPSDNRIIECALESKSDYIVSGDKRHLLSLKKYRRIRLVSAGHFLDILKALPE